MDFGMGMGVDDDDGGAADRPRGPDLDDDAPLALLLEPPPAPAPAGEAGSCTYFKIVKADPSRQKVMSVASGVGRRLRSSDMVISLHGVDHSPDGGVVLASQPSSDQPVHVLSSLARLSPSVVEQHMLEWPQVQCLSYSLDLVALDSRLKPD
eukprot:10110571-Alexandrium_andersonii.AAC.1